MFGAPVKDTWHDMKLVPAICHLLRIPQNSHTIVNETMTSILNDEVYDGSRKSGAGRVPLIQEGTDQAGIVYRALEAGLSSKDTACILNIFRASLADPLEAISRSAVQGFAQRSQCIHVRKRGLKKSGKQDHDCCWAKARMAQAHQMKEQLRLGELPVDHPDRSVPIYSPIYIDGIAFWDEHHRAVILGDAGAYQYQVSRNEEGVVTTPAEGGKMSEVKDVTSVKYPGEGRGCFGVAVVTRDGVREGLRALPFNYTNRKVVAEKAFEFAMKMEANRVKILKGMWGIEGAGYPERYGENWRPFVREEVFAALTT